MRAENIHEETERSRRNAHACRVLSTFFILPYTYPMLDIAFIRENRDFVATAMQNKRAEPIDFDALFALDDERTALRTKISDLNAARNAAARERNIEEGRRLKEEAARLEASLADVSKRLLQVLDKIPNIPSADTPIGPDESGNKVVRQVGERPAFPFTPKPHWELGAALDIIDSETAGTVSGARFTYLKGDLVLLQFALLDLALKTLLDRTTLADIASRAGLSVDPRPFVPVLPPVFMRAPVMHRMARLNPIEDRYYYKEDDLVMVGSAEHTLGPLHMDQILDEKSLPLRYVGYSTAFRREAGSYGKDTKGILRQHQFDKVEMESFVLGEQSYQEQDFFVAIQEHLMQALKLPYQVVLVCTGDMGKPDHRQIDIETWMPGQNTYRETHSADLVTTYQSRRLNTRVRRAATSKAELVHMNDATVFAMGRTLIAIIENYQNEDGTIRVPEVLRQYVGKEVVGKREQ